MTFAGDRDIAWLLEASDGVLALRRGDAACAVNLSPAAYELPADLGTVVLASDRSSTGCYRSTPPPGS